MHHFYDYPAGPNEPESMNGQTTREQVQTTLTRHPGTDVPLGAQMLTNATPVTPDPTASTFATPGE